MEESTTDEGDIEEVKIGEETRYHIACTGDGFVTTDCAVELGDWLIPSETKGLATKYTGDGFPKNYIGKAGETITEAGKIAFTKE